MVLKCILNAYITILHFFPVMDDWFNDCKIKIYDMFKKALRYYYNSHTVHVLHTNKCWCYCEEQWINNNFFHINHIKISSFQECITQAKSGKHQKNWHKYLKINCYCYSTFNSNILNFVERGGSRRNYFEKTTG